MPVETPKSTLFQDRIAEVPSPDPILYHGRIGVMTGEVANAADASVGSKYHLCDLPADCMLHRDTFFVVDQWGFGGVRIGTFDDADALLSAAKSDATVQYPVAAGDAKFDKRLWQLLGLTQEPKGHIGLYAHTIAGATGAGTLRFQIVTIGTV
jgi:hypothetical protein